MSAELAHSLPCDQVSCRGSPLPHDARRWNSVFSGKKKEKLCLEQQPPVKVVDNFLFFEPATITGSRRLERNIDTTRLLPHVTIQTYVPLDG